MRKLFVFVALLAVVGANFVEMARAAECFRTFDGPAVAWQLIDGRAGTSIVSHGCVGDEAREGSGSERVSIAAPGGESLHFICPAGRIPVLDELEVRMWIKASRPGVTLAARVVLPRSTDPNTGAAKTTFISGEQCATADRWQQLRLGNVPDLLAAQVRAMRAARGASIDPREAYVDAIVLVVPGGPGNTVAWTDALEVDGVVMPAAAESSTTPQTMPALFSGTAPALRTTATPPAPSTTAPPATAPPAQFQGTTLMVGGRPFLMHGIQWNNEPLAFLAARGFNTVWLDEPPTSEQTTSAARAGLWLVCTPPAPDELAKSGIDPSFDRVLAWNLGTPAGPRDLDSMRRWAELVRNRDPLVARPIIVAPRGDWQPASRLADVLVADHPAASSLSQANFAEWLQTLPRLARPGTPLWVRIPTQPGPRTRQQLAALSPDGRASPTALDDLQLAALVSAATTNGCRGYVFQSDSPLDAQDEASQRRAMLLEALNNQLNALSPWLTIGKPIGDATSTDSTATGIVLQAERARLLVPTSWGAPAADSATAPNKSVAFTVPGVPESNEAYLLSPVELQSLESKRVAGGTRVTLDRHAAGMVLMTEDPAVITGFRQHIARGGSRAAQLEYALASARARSLAGLASRLPRIGVSTKKMDRALGLANAELRSVNQLLSANDWAAAYDRSTAASQILSAAFEAAGQSIAPAPKFNSSPFSADAGSLLRQAEFEKSLASLAGGENLLAGGDFENLDQLRRLGWQHVDDPMPGIPTKVQLSGRTPQEGRFNLELTAVAVPATAAPQIVARPLVWITSPPIRATAGEVIEISGWVRVVEPIRGSIDGLEIVDSLGGQELSLRIRSTTDWQPFRMIRSTRDTTEMTLTFALTGLGSASVDGVMVRSLSAPSVKRLPTVSSEPGPAFPNSARRSLFPPPIER